MKNQRTAIAVGSVIGLLWLIGSLAPRTPDTPQASQDAKQAEVAEQKPQTQAAEPAQIDGGKAEELMTIAYLMHVNPDGEKGPVRCNLKPVEGENFVLCLYPSAGAEPVHRGLWVAKQNGEDFKFYAVNGKALTALEKLSRYPDEFMKQPQAHKIDIPKVLAAF